MDEPLGALDEQLRDALQLEIKRTSRQGERVGAPAPSESISGRAAHGGA
jgi:hypothetical protein